MGQERDNSLDAVRGFAILLVMIGHCIVLNNMADGYFYDAIKAVQMPLFMVVSGYAAGRKKSDMTGRELGRQIGKRAVSCLVPFVSWIFLTNVTDFPGKFIRVLYQPDTGLWFLLTLFLLNGMLCLALYVKDGLKMGWVGFCIAAAMEAAVISLHYLSGNTFLGPALTVNYFPFYFGGFLTAAFLSRRQDGKQGEQRRAEKICRAGRISKSSRISKRMIFWVGFVLFLILVVRFDMVYAHSRMEWLLQMLASACGTYICFYGIYHLPQGKMKSLFSYLGMYTLEIYVLHFRFARILGKQDAGLSLYSIKGAGVGAVTFLIMSVLTAFFIFTLKKLAVTDFLLFGKIKKK
ncbi:MAG: acyltransferase family protein [Clostridiales bacterium]|nr:acyltransferase family protein [Clostridiales bacterium]